MPNNTLGPEAKATALRMYDEMADDGRKKFTTEEIYQKTGVSRPALYMLLRKEGRSPDRQKERRFTPGLDAAALLTRLERAQVELGAALAEIEHLKQRIAILEAELEERELEAADGRDDRIERLEQMAHVFELGKSTAAELADDRP